MVAIVDMKLSASCDTDVQREAHSFFSPNPYNESHCDAARQLSV
jgi:hypothetical protein